MNHDVTILAEQIYPLMVEWRRDFHKHPESGWLELRTASIVASRLSKWGYDVLVGKDVIDKDSRMGLPSIEILRKHEKLVLEQGIDSFWVSKMKEGFTGVVATLDTKRPGKTIALRFDMDSLDLIESNDIDHIPFKENFQSINEGMMHACGHDAHTSIGLGLAKLIIDQKELVTGKIKLIFQPAEEGVRGAKSMVAAGVVDDVEIFIASHVGTGVPLGEIIAGTKGFLATTKIDATFTGKAAHAGGNPEEGKNAMLAAASAILGLHSIPRHSAGNSRINVGVCQSGTGRNIIPSSAKLQLETRGETTIVNEFMFEQAMNVLKGAAAMYDVALHLDIVGGAKNSESSPYVMEQIVACAKHIKEIQKVSMVSEFSAGSEDATYMMERVKENGGHATYAIFGTTLAAGHHNEKFDIDESVMLIALKTLFHTIKRFSANESLSESRK